MAYEIKNNILVLHKNKFKKTDKHPDYKGKVIVEGNEKDASMWKNENINGETFYRIKLEDPYNPGGANDSVSTTGGVTFEGDSDTPY